MSRARGQRGYTVVELIISIFIFAIAVAGVIAMQKVAVTSNQHAKNLGMGTRIAESWMDMLATDAVTWNSPSTFGGSTPDIGQTVWLQAVSSNANQSTSWTLPAWDANLQFGPAFDALGNPINPATSPGEVKYCTHLRLSWLYQPTAAGNGLIRAEVRVFWPKEGQGMTATTCTAAQIANVIAAPEKYHFVQKISAIRETMP